MDWNYISKYQKLSEKFIGKHKDEVDWYSISKYQTLSEEFIEKYESKCNWGNISLRQILSENFIKKYKNRVNWDNISMNQKLSEKFIEKYKNEVDWYYICAYQKLSEEFIEKYKNYINWVWISKYQTLSEEFIEKHKNKVDWECISRYQKLSKKFIEKHKLEISNTCWAYKTNQEKLQYIKENNLPYELSKNEKHIIAYKSTRDDGYSVFNSQYQYEVGKTYKSHCNCNIDNPNSFGLSAWTKEGALKYYDKGKIFKVKISIKDIGCFVHGNNKIRCRKLEILEEVKEK